MGNYTGAKPEISLSDPVTTVISPQGRRFSLDLRELWSYRDLLWLFVWRDISIRYKQSLVGIGWAILQPVALMIVFSIVFGRLADLPSDGSPYPIFTYCALLPWIYFSRSLVGVSDSLISSANLITKIYFPRLILPLSKVFVGLVDFAIALVVLVGMMLWYEIKPHAGVVFLPLFIIVALLTALGVGVWLSALNVKYRDIGLAVPFFVQVWLFASPVAYATSLVPEEWRWAYGLNPMVGVIEGFRWALLGQTAPNISIMVASTAIAGFLLVSGWFYFRKTEREFADVI
jgi:lipopolysaccharide transport system permease protein